MSELLNIPLAQIRENQVALRGVNRTEETFKELVDSVRTHGIITPISVRRKPTGKDDHPDGKEFELIDGLHRFSAALEAGLKDIPAQVLDKTTEEALVTQILANLHKVDTKPVEYTKALIRLLAAHPLMTEAELANMLSQSPTWVGQRLSLTKLHPDIQNLVNEGRINLSNAFPLTKLPQEEQIQWVEKAMTQGINEFGPAVLKRSKELRDAARKGREANPAEFQPVAYARKMSEIKDEMANGKVGPSLIKSIYPNGATPEQAFALAVAWILNMDPLSQEDQRRRDKERKDAAAAEKEKRDAERASKRADEARTRQAELDAQAKAARERLTQRQSTVPAAENGEPITAGA
jgi:ParB/RepB/Spo0J family partition protein